MADSYCVFWGAEDPNDIDPHELASARGLVEMPTYEKARAWADVGDEQFLPVARRLNGRWAVITSPKEWCSSCWFDEHENCHGGGCPCAKWGHYEDEPEVADGR